jgi:MerR family transcriptional regulator, redox-sensitive transcriptional activator SoxR
MSPDGRDDDLLAIGEVARRSGMSVSRIRFYESCGVLAEPQRHAGKRRYSPDVLTQLTVIDAAQRVGFSLEEIKDLVWGRGDPAHERLRQLAIRKLPEIDELIERATAVRHLLDICSTCECASIADCLLLTEPLGPPRDQPAAVALKRRLVGPPTTT